MSVSCKCGRKHGDLADLVVVDRKCNYSHFNPGKGWASSDYSLIWCTRPGCDGHKRTKAAYVDRLPDGKIPSR
jgi:hypothetical protein